jgi:hypothetical protein
VSNLPLLFAICGPVIFHGEIITRKNPVVTKDDLDDIKSIMKLKIATCDIRGLSNKSEELTEEVEK